MKNRSARYITDPKRPLVCFIDVLDEFIVEAKTSAIATEILLPLYEARTKASNELESQRKKQSEEIAKVLSESRGRKEGSDA